MSRGNYTSEPDGFTSTARRRYVNETARAWLKKAREARTPEWRYTCIQCALGARRGYQKVTHA